MPPYATRIFPEPSFKIAGNRFQPYPSVFQHGMSYAKHHIRIIRPFARPPSAAMTVLHNLPISGKTLRIIPQDLFTGHKLSS